MIFREEKEASKTYKQNYLDGIKALLSVRQKAAEQVRAEYIKDVFKNAEKYRNDFKKMLGFPLVDFVYDGAPNLRSTKLADEENYEIFRMEIEILDGLFMSGLFFKMKGEEKKPLVLVSHGGLGTPELISGIYGSLRSFEAEHAKLFADADAAKRISVGSSERHKMLRGQISSLVRPVCKTDMDADFIAEALISWSVEGTNFDILDPIFEKIIK